MSVRRARLTLAEAEHVFDEYVFGMMRRDIEREVALAYEPGGGGNVLAAMGLLSFTDVLGHLVQRTGVRPIGPFPKLGTNEARFMEGLYRLGPPYASLHKSGADPWSLRNDWLHAYALDQSVHVYMRHEGHAAPGLMWRAAEGEWDFIVESYLRDFLAAAQVLRADVRAALVP